VLALIAAYLEYEVYPSIMSGAPFLESDISLHLSLFSYAYDSVRCTPDVSVANCPAGSVQTIIGIPAFDFFQLFIAVIIIVNIYHALRLSKKR
jgi:hypothetical protein